VRVFVPALLLALAVVGGLLLAIVAGMPSLPLARNPGDAPEAGPCDQLPAQGAASCRDSGAQLYILECWVLRLPCA
jgi:hypothetical protein